VKQTKRRARREHARHGKTREERSNRKTKDKSESALDIDLSDRLKRVQKRQGK